MSPVPASAATDAACALLDELVAGGVRHLVLSPGSRSQALALAAAELERQGRVRLHVRIDERVAGFVALGIGRETRRPAAVICTSGTAVANLLPAVLEAHHAGVPLLLLTADRPPELRGVGANQTTAQPGIFGASTRWAVDAPVPAGAAGEGEEIRRTAARALEEAAGRGTARVPGPVHLNLPYREPLAGALPTWFVPPRDPTPTSLVDLSERRLVDRSERSERSGDGSSERSESRSSATGDGSSERAWLVDRSERSERSGDGSSERSESRSTAATAPPPPAAESQPSPEPHVLRRGPRTVVLAGADAGPAAEEIAHRGGWPLIAEVVSGARFGRNLVHGYRAALRDPALGGAIERVAVLGHPTLARETAALLGRRDVEVVAVRCGADPLNLNGRTLHVDRLEVERGASDREWLGAWMRHARAHRTDLAAPAPDLAGLQSTDPRERLGAVDAELRAVRRPVDRALLVDAVWHATWPHDRLVFGSSRLVRVADEVLGGKKVPVHANRGLAGIDGTIATAIGVATAAQDAGATGVTRVLLGDLALLHDAGALLRSPGEAAPRLQVVVGNDGGGTIFDGLEVAGTADPADMTRVQYTPHDVDLAALAAAYGWEHTRATTRVELDQALLAPTAGPRIIEVPLAR